MNDISQSVTAAEGAIRLGCFITVLVIILLWEVAAPKRALKISKLRRWPSNFGVMVVNTVLLRVLFPTAAVGMAAYADTEGWGLFNRWDSPLWLSVLVCVITLDIVIYFQHRLLHVVPGLWRVHRMHHADLDFDVSTGGRFHPIEIILSILIKGAAVMGLGAPVLAVVLFEIILSASSLFNHGNVKIPLRLDHCLRWVLVTPDMHRVHHSVEGDETNHNFGFNLTWWDRMFGTYRAQPRATHEEMDIGIPAFRSPRRCQNLPGMLAIPFVKDERE